MQAKRRAAFIRIWRVPIANQTTLQALEDAFPNVEFDVIDMLDLLKQNKSIMLNNLRHLIQEYGWKIIFDPKQAKRTYFVTTYLFGEMKRMLAVRLRQEDYAFTFQMQSLFDGAQRGIPHFVYTDHTIKAQLAYASNNFKQLQPSTAWQAKEQEIYRHATVNFVRSQHIYRSLTQQYGLDDRQVRCVFAGPNAPMTPIDPQQKSYRPKRILFVGIEWERKGGPTLLAAFEKVLAKHPDATLTIVGCSPTVTLPNCHVLGRVALETVADCFRESTIFCLPTLLEPFGIAFMEALSFALPIVATDVGAIPDFVTEGENGRLVPPNAVNPLAEALLTLLDSEQVRQEMGAQSHTLAQQRYHWHLVADKMRETIMPYLVVPT